ncbi:MAG: L,D-transpeptidase family protein [Candidatus Woesearchaeota archaeon]
MNKQILFLIALLVLIFNVVAEGEVDPLLAFEKEPTAENLLKIAQPNSYQFIKLSELERARYISSLSPDDFKDPNKQQIGYVYFTEAVSNINGDKDSFVVYLKGLGVSITSFDGDIKGYGSDHILIGKSQSINLQDFKKGGRLGEKYSISIREGEIYLILKDTQEQVSFQGKLKQMPSQPGSFSIDKGSINGMTIEKGENIKISTGKIVSGTAKEFAGMVFSSSTPFSYDSKENILSLDGARVISVGSTANIYVRGSLIIEPSDYAKINGNLKIKLGTKVSVNGVETKAQTQDVKLEYQGSSLFPEGIHSLFAAFKTGELSNTVTATPTEIEAQGEGYETKVPAGNLVSSSKGIGNINLPKKGYLSVGDKGEEVSKVQDMLVSKGYLKESDGIFGSQTETALKAWQREAYSREGVCTGSIQGSNCIADGKFGTRSLQTYLGANPRSAVVINPKQGRVVVSGSDGRVGIDVQGSSEVKVGDQQLEAKGSILLKGISPWLGVPLDVESSDVTLRDETGDIVNAYKRLTADAQTPKKVENILASSPKYTGVIIDVDSQKLFYFENGQQVSRSNIGVGTGNDPNNPSRATETPRGDFKIAGFQDNKGSGKWATEYDALRALGLGANEGYKDTLRGRLLNVYGPGYISLQNTKTGEVVPTGIHGTNVIGSTQLFVNSLTGKNSYVSHGCMRMNNDEWLQLRSKVKSGTKVKIV